MKSLRRILTIARKEVLESLSTPILFVAETTFVLLTGYFFYLGMIYYSQLSADWISNPAMQQKLLDPTAILLPPVFSNYALLLLFFVPMLTMSTFASERKSGTLELLFTLPVRDVELVMGKWLGITVLIFFLFLPLWIYPGVAIFFGLHLTWQTFASGFLGLLLLAFFFAAVGVFISSLFESQAASAVMTVGILMIFWTLEGSEIFQLDAVTTFLANFSIQKYLQPFSRGVISTENVFMFLIGILFFLFLTFRSLEKRSFRNPL